MQVGAKWQLCEKKSKGREEQKIPGIAAVRMSNRARSPWQIPPDGGDARAETGRWLARTQRGHVHGDFPAA
jgi:hypothetical protein